MKNNNIPENWTEKDYEKQEIAHMVRSSFRIAIQDLSAIGRVSKAAVEYWEQLGIHPQIGRTTYEGIFVTNTGDSKCNQRYYYQSNVRVSRRDGKKVCRRPSVCIKKNRTR
jgi:hypothetical protein